MTTPKAPELYRAELDFDGTCEYCGAPHSPGCEYAIDDRCETCDECSVRDVALDERPLCSERGCKSADCSCPGGDECYRQCA